MIVASTTTSTTATPCSDSEVKCPSGFCILKTFVCDGEDDCLDNWDESNCSTYYIEIIIDFNPIFIIDMHLQQRQAPPQLRRQPPLQ